VERREFVKSAMAVGAGAGLGMEAQATAQASVGAGGGNPTSQNRDAGHPEYYQLRTYTLRTGPQTALCQGYFERALIPALNRLSMGPVGAFKLDVGPETPTYYVLIPSMDVEALVGLDARLGADAEYVKAAGGFRDAPANAPAFVRSERTLLGAFAGWPKLAAPKAVDGELPKRIFQLRTYESASQTAHVRKMQMFNEAEIAIFTRVGLAPVFFGDTQVGTRMPSLTYMLTFASLAELTERWAAFSADAAWRELSHRPGNADAEIVNNISNLYLSPLDCSQV
jgi:hypothetical protein